VVISSRKRVFLPTAYLILILGIIAAASSALFIQMTHLSREAPFLLAMSRLLVAAVVLAPFMIRQLRQHGRSLSRADFVRAAPAALFLGLHLGAWNIGVAHSTVANASLIVNLNPVAMPILLYFLVRERLTRGEIVGTVVALLGVTVLILGDATLGFGASTIKGDLICIGAMVLVVAYLAATKFRARGTPMFIYLIPLYLGAAAVCAPIAAWEAAHLDTINQRDWIAILGLGLIPTVIGHSAFNYSMVHLRSQVFSIANLGQFVVAAALDWLIHRHLPSTRFYLAAVLIVIGAIVVVTNPPKPDEPNGDA
jgi:drug/metabolite transporter (DMT)-like permease